LTRAAGIVLAAGEGRRFGGAKLLARLDSRPLLQHVLDTCAAARLEPVIVVLGSDSAAVDEWIRWGTELRVRNPDPGRGLASSLRVGMAALRDADARTAQPLPTSVLILLGDQPRLEPAQVARIVSASRDPGRPVVVPRYADGQPGNPVRVEREGWSLVDQLEGDRGLAQLFESRPELVRFVDVAGTNPDIDTPADLAALSRGGGPARSDRTAAAGRSTPSAVRRPRK
jgi:molybdenum cofactor cytidylyltransferase